MYLTLIEEIENSVLEQCPPLEVGTETSVKFPYFLVHHSGHVLSGFRQSLVITATRYSIPQPGYSYDGPARC